MDGTVSGKNLINVLDAMGSALKELNKPIRVFFLL